MPLTRWPLQDAKNKFSAVVEAALGGNPQLVTKRGRPAVVVLAADDYDRLRHLERTEAPSFADFLLTIPQDDAPEDDDPFERLPLEPREVDF